MVEGSIQIPMYVQPATFCPSTKEVEKAVSAIANAKRPLVIVGKGAASGRAEIEVR